MARYFTQLNTGVSRNLAMASAKESGERRSGRGVIETVELPEKVKDSRILILGGTGRVGGSTAVALSKFCPALRIVIGGRNRDKGAAMVSKLGNGSEFSEVDINDSESLDAALKDVDLVVHTAGPFQQAQNCAVLEAAVRNKTAYLDVCDDTNYAWRAKSYMKKAVDANIPAITTGGIYPGVSNVMAAELVRASKFETKGEPEKLRFYYYTAGSGGAGPTILSTSFLLLGEEVIAYNKGEKVKLKPYSGMLNINFGLGIGKKNVFLLALEFHDQIRHDVSVGILEHRCHQTRKIDTGKDELLTGASTRPEKSDFAYRAWNSENNLVMSWLINSMTTEIGENFLLYTTAKDIWDATRDTFSSKENMSELFEIESILQDLRQGYYTFLTRHWQQLDLFEVHEWKCPDDEHRYKTIVEKRRIFKFLLSLNNTLDEVLVES